MDRIIKNKFAKACCSAFCGEMVSVGEGFAVCVDKKWSTYHENCLPETAKAKLVETNPEEPKRFINQKGELFFPYNPAIIQAVKCIPGRTWNGQKRCWTIPVDANSITIALPIFDSFEIAYPEEFKGFVGSESADKIDDQITVYNADKLYDYQIEGSKFLSTHRRALLGDEMGTGKTIQALAAIPENSRVLIIAPACVKYNWAKEAAKWRPEFKSVVVQGKDNFALPVDNQIVVCNREIIPDYFLNKDPNAPQLDFDKEMIENLREIVVIIDEAHYFKGIKTGCHKKLKNITKHAKKVWALTGTPLTSRPIDLWGVLSACDMENIVFSNNNQKPFNFFASCFQAYKGKYGLIWGNPLPEVANLLSKVHICRKRRDVLPQLPPKMYTDLEVEIGRGRTGAKIKRKLDSLHTLYGDAFAAGKLPPFEEFAEVRADLACSRVDAMLEYIDDCEENEVPLVVFSAHVKPFDVLRGRIGWAIIDGSTKAEDRQKIVEAFQSGLLQGVACTIQAGGVGITLTRAWKALFIDQDWVPANNWQAEDRICRLGQKSDRVEIVRLVSNHPLDRRLMELLGNKADLIDKTFNR